MSKPGLLLSALALWVLPMHGQQKSAESFTPDGIQFFETEVRPLLRSQCVACHSVALKTSGLSVESREAILTGGNRGPAVEPGRPAESRLIQAIEQTGDLKMPPTGRLPDDKIAVLRRWVELRLPWPEAERSQPARRAASTHWSFQPVRSPSPPAVKNSAWVRNPIDRFILARLEKQGIAPSPEADKATLMRRLSLDLLGLPPTLAEVDQFVSDSRADAYERLVERLLASPHYGERWGRHWLDLARYADSNGYNIDGAREIWKYRDWVIEALNRDLPFDRFVIEQVAGDLLPNATKEQLTATGFHRNTLLNLEGGIDFEQYRVDAVADRVDTTGAVFLGLTLGCARCHDHKYDPIAQREYYQLFAFFNNIDELDKEKGEAGRQTAQEPTIEFATPEQLIQRDAIRAQVRALRKELGEYQKTLLARLPEWEKSLGEKQRQELKPEIQEILSVAAAERNDAQKKALEAAFRNMDLGYRERQAGIAELEKRQPKIVTTMVMREREKPRPNYVHLGGDFLRRGVEVSPGVPAVLPPLPPAERPTRLDLARWLVDPNNPLTPRVTVNRVWQRYFGRGLVETENDFGAKGSPPTHPELLDWLAAEFMDGGWSMKALHRLIVTSSTYRQSSRHRPEVTEVDPDNRLLARQARLRLEAEIIRDAALAASGLLTPAIGGPSVFPPQPEGASKVGQIQRDWIADTGPNRFRRGMYTYFWRSAPHPGLTVFDAPDSTTACTRRSRSNTPLQMLTLLNDQAFYEFAQGLAERLLKEGPSGNPDRLRYAFRLCLARQPKPEELERLERFFHAQLDDFQTRPEEARAVAPVAEGDVALRAAWTSAARVLLNLDEFITRE